MKLLNLLGLLAVCALATTGESQQETTKDAIKYEMKDLEANFGIKFKSAKVVQKTTDGEALITITLQFTKEVPDNGGDSNRYLIPLRKLFAGVPSSAGTQLQCYFFDEDGVVFAKQPPGKIEGEVSGKADDAFRVSQMVSGEILAKTRKISFREEPVKK